MGALAAGFLFLLGADWSGALVRPGFAGPWRLVPSHTTALGSWEVHSRRGGMWSTIAQLTRSADVTTSHTTTMGSWEVHSDVGLVSAGEDTLHVGRIEPCGGGRRSEVLFWDVSGANGVTAGGCLLSFAP
jgi:hypothetical protein